jgi:flap endonuclease-1
MVDNGIKPCYIFDGKPPELKGGVVSRPYFLVEEEAEADL